jgi:outer membrane biosynthesis protein TonB
MTRLNRPWWLFPVIPLIVTLALVNFVDPATNNTVTLAAANRQPAEFSETKLIALDPVADARLGAALAVDGDTAVAGAPRADGLVASSGAVYLLQRGNAGWSLQDKLTASDGEANDQFGAAVALSGDLMVVGAPGDDDKGFTAGAAYLLRFDGANWVEEQKLTPSRAGDATFGFAVAAQGDLVVVGAPRQGSGTLNVGSVYIFERVNGIWVEVERLTSGLGGGAVQSDLFGWSVAVSGNQIAIGAYLADAVYLYVKESTGWVKQPALRGDDTATNDRFGHSVALEGATLVVGAPHRSDPANRSGAAYLFQFTAGAWQQVTKLLAGDGRAGAHFGWSVALASPFVAVGARDSRGLNDREESGAVYLYQQTGNGWASTKQLNASDSRPFDHYGEVVALSDAFVGVGAPDHHAGQTAAGALYFYNLPGDGPTPEPSETPDGTPTTDPEPSVTPDESPTTDPEPSATPDESPTTDPEPSETPDGTPTIDPEPSETPDGTPTTDPEPSETPTNPPPTAPPPGGPISADCTAMSAMEQTSEQVLPDVTLTWDSSFHCQQAAETGSYAFVLTIAYDDPVVSAANGPVVINDLVLRHTTPRPGGQGPEASVNVSGLPLQLAPGGQAQLAVSGDYELAQTGATQRANLHFCASGELAEGGQLFTLGLNAHLRGATPSPADNDLFTPPVISDLQILPGPASILVRWQTDQPSTGQVIVGIGAALADAVTVSEGCVEQTSHSVEIKGLTPETEYHVQVIARNSDGVVATSALLQATPAQVGELRTYLPAVAR